MAEQHLMTLSKGKLKGKELELAKAFFHPVYLDHPQLKDKGKDNGKANTTKANKRR